MQFFFTWNAPYLSLQQIYKQRLFPCLLHTFILPGKTTPERGLVTDVVQVQMRNWKSRSDFSFFCLLACPELVPSSHATSGLH